MVRRKLGGLLIAMFLSACGDITQPVVALDNKGRVLKGTATAGLDGRGSYTVSNGRITCTGNYNAFDASLTIPLSILCDNGMTGIGSATRTANGLSGSGTFVSSDGAQWRFVFGGDAAALL